jgi:hypothetical protein
MPRTETDPFPECPREDLNKNMNIRNIIVITSPLLPLFVAAVVCWLPGCLVNTCPALHAGGTVLDDGAVLDLTNLVQLGASLQLCLVKYYARRALLAAGKRNTFNNIDPSVLQQLPEYLRELFPCHCAVDEEDGPQSQKGSILVMKGFAQWASSSLKEG